MIILNSIRIKYFFNDKELTNSSIESKNQKNTFQIYVKGMTCSHCVDSVTKSLLNLSGVKEVQINLSLGQVNVAGKDFNKDIIEENIISLGYTIKEK